MKKHSVGVVLWMEAAVVAAVFTFQVVVCGGRRTLLYFFDIPSIVCLLVCVVPALLISGMGRDFTAAFLVGKRRYPLAQMKKSLEAVKMVQRLVLCSMGFTVVISLVILLYQMTELSTMGPSFAVMVLTVLYGIVAEFLLIPVSALLQNRITEAMDVPEEETTNTWIPSGGNHEEV